MDCNGVLVLSGLLLLFLAATIFLLFEPLDPED